MTKFLALLAIPLLVAVVDADQNIRKRRSALKGASLRILQDDNDQGEDDDDQGDGIDWGNSTGVYVNCTGNATDFATNSTCRKGKRGSSSDALVEEEKIGKGATNGIGGWEAGGSAFPAADQLCLDFCASYKRACGNQNGFFNPDKPRGYPSRAGSRGYRRNLIAGAEDLLPRFDSDALAESEENCLASCMQYPRPIDPSTQYTNIDDFGVNLGSDTLWCRMRHLSLADGGLNGGGIIKPYEAAFHCPHASPSGGGICTDSLVDGATPFEHYRQGLPTRRRYGYCDLLKDDTVAECTKSGITDANLADALRMIPDTVTMIFMNNNQGVTNLPNGIFGSLKCPTCIKSLFFEDASIATVDENAFAPLVNLEVLNLNMNLISSLPPGLFSNNRYLKQFSMFAGSKAGSGALTSLPASLFQNNPYMEAIIIYGHPGLVAFPSGIFNGLTRCEIISFVNCGFTNAGFPNGVFSSLVSLQYFDFFGNQLTSVEARWFAGGWGSNILRLALNNNANLASIENGAFDSLTSLEVAYFHENSPQLTYLSETLFQNNPNLISVTFGTVTI